VLDDYVPCYLQDGDLVTSPAGGVAMYCDVSVCLSKDISGTTCAIFSNFSLHVAYGRGSVLLWQGDEIHRGRGTFGDFLPH